MTQSALSALHHSLLVLLSCCLFIATASGQKFFGGAGDGFGVGNGSASGTLPVELVTFVAEPHGTSVLLKWTTHSEQNNAGFAVERSSDGIIFETIAWVTGAGTTSQQHHYQHTDNQPGSGRLWYRLRQIDYDGQESPSWIVSVRINRGVSVAVFPNPATENLFVRLDQFSGQKVSLTLLTPLGFSVRTISLPVSTATTAQLNVKGLPAGSYWLRLQAGSLVEQLPVQVTGW